MKRYTAVWDDEYETPLNGSVVLTKERFACDVRTDGELYGFITTSVDGILYLGYIEWPEQRLAGTFTQPRDPSERLIEFRRHRATRGDGRIRMECLRWWSADEAEGGDDQCDILLIPVEEPQRAVPKKARKPTRKSSRKK